MRTFVLLLCAAALWAATTLDGTWKLNREKSTVHGPLPSFIHNDRMSVRPSGTAVLAAFPSSFIALDGSVEVSPDRRILTRTRIQSYEDQGGKWFHTVLVLEKQ